MHFKMSSAICLNLDRSEILSPGNGVIRPASTALMGIFWEHVLQPQPYVAGYKQGNGQIYI